MSLIFILFICTARTAANTCVKLLNVEEVRNANQFPGWIWKWNRDTREFVLLEAVSENRGELCSVDYLEDLSGTTIVVSSDTMYPYVLPNVDGGVTGYIGDIWTTLEEALKFRSIYRQSRLSAGQTLKKGEVQVWLAATTIQTYASSFYCYSHQVGTNYYGLFVLSEGTRVSKWWYTSIFSTGLWIMSFSFVVGIAVLLLVMYRLKRAVCPHYVECDNEFAIASFNFLNVLGVITGQGFQKIPTSWSLRILIISAVIMGMLISCGFSSTLTSYLAIQSNYLPLNSLEDVAQKRTHSLCVRNDSGAYLRLTNRSSSHNGELRSEWRELVNKNCPDMKNRADLRSKICRSGFVYLEAPDIFLSLYRQVQHHCPIVQIPEIYWSLKLAFLHSRSAPHRRVIDKYLLRLRSAGILKYLERKWISREPPNSNERQWGFQAVRQAHIALISIALITMMFVSAFICVIENIWFTLKSTKVRKIRVPRRSERLNNFKSFPLDFPAIELDPASRRVWATNEII